MSQHAGLFGSVNFVPDPSFRRVASDTFVVMTWGTRSGSFSAITWQGLPAADSFDVVLETNRMLLISKASTTAVGPGVAASSELRFRTIGSLSAPLAFELDLPGDAVVRVTLLDAMGRVVARLGEGRMSAGVHRLVASQALAPGPYFARASVEREGRTETRVAKAIRLR